MSAQTRLAFMESVGIECAAWPHLYWKISMCETYIRSQDKRLLQRADKPDEDESCRGRRESCLLGVPTQKHGSLQSSCHASLGMARSTSWSCSCTTYGCTAAWTSVYAVSRNIHACEIPIFCRLLNLYSSASRDIMVIQG